MTEAFDLAEFYDVTSDIERYLGWLKGNEAALEWWEAYQESLGDRGRVFQGPGFISTPSEADYWVTYQVGGLPGDVTTEEMHDIARQCHEAMQQSWDNGVAWAAGIAGYVRSLCADIVRPNAATLESSVQAFSDSMVALEGGLPVDWTDLDFTSWVGASSDECQDTVTEFQAVVRDQYLTYYAHAFSLYGGACALVTQAQAGLVPALKDVRRVLEAQLAAWAERGHRPHSYAGAHPQAADIASIVTRVTAKIPVWGKIQSTITDFAGLGNDILGLFGSEVELFAWEAFEAKDAETIYTQMTAMLQDAYLTPLQNGMDALDAERGQPIAAAQNGIHPWFLPELAGVENEPWKHEAED